LETDYRPWGVGVNWNEEENYRILTHDWKYPDDPGRPPWHPDKLAEDISETEHLYYNNHLKMVELQALLRNIQYRGRSP
jgi:hypothetical protein